MCQPHNVPIYSPAHCSLILVWLSVDIFRGTLEKQKVNTLFKILSESRLPSSPSGCGPRAGHSQNRCKGTSVPKRVNIDTGWSGVACTGQRSALPRANRGQLTRLTSEALEFLHWKLNILSTLPQWPGIYLQVSSGYIFLSSRVFV